MEFVDRLLKCSDCGTDFVFTAGEQLFFFDKQFKNDPKRCKLCKAKRAGLTRTAAAGSAVALPLSRTETRTQCSACGVDTTVPFKPTQGRPVLCRSCFQMKRVPAAVAAILESPAEQVARQSAALEGILAEGGVTAVSPAVQAVEEAPLAVVTADAGPLDAELVAALADAPHA
jgi:CxxC-x17-CxxC domain-containing protein